MQGFNGFLGSYTWSVGGLYLTLAPVLITLTCTSILARTP